MALAVLSWAQVAEASQSATSPASTTTSGSSTPAACGNLRKVITFSVNGSPVSSLRGNVSSGDSVAATVTPPANCLLDVKLSTFTEASGTFGHPNTGQAAYQSVSGRFAGPSSATLGPVSVPACYFQVDATVTYGHGEKTFILSADNGGSSACFEGPNLSASGACAVSGAQAAITVVNPTKAAVPVTVTDPDNGVDAFSVGAGSDTTRDYPVFGTFQIDSAAASFHQSITIADCQPAPSSSTTAATISTSCSSGVATATIDLTLTTNGPADASDTVTATGPGGTSVQAMLKTAQPTATLVLHTPTSDPGPVTVSDSKGQLASAILAATPACTPSTSSSTIYQAPTTTTIDPAGSTTTTALTPIVTLGASSGNSATPATASKAATATLAFTGIRADILGFWGLWLIGVGWLAVSSTRARRAAE